MEENSKISGLSSSHAGKLLLELGQNKIPEPRGKTFRKLLLLVVSPITLMLIGASLLSFYVGKIFDGYLILTLLGINLLVTILQEKKADDAVSKLNDKISSTIYVLRDKKWLTVDSKDIVPGDVVKLTSGQVIPADGEVLFANKLSINESVVTGESLSKAKKQSAKLYSGSFLDGGILIMKVTATGGNTYFGKTIKATSESMKKSILEKDIVKVTRFLSFLSIASILFLTVYFYLLGYPISETLQLDLTLLIAGIPISLPTVMTLIIEIGVIVMAKKNVIVRRLSSLEDISNANYLLTDKTGTITQNKIEVQEVTQYGNYQEKDVLFFSYIVATSDDTNVLNQAIVNRYKLARFEKTIYKKLKFSPFDPKEKVSSGEFLISNKKLEIIVGAPQVVLEKATDKVSIERKFKSDIESLAKRGFKSIAVSANGKLVGLLGFSDILRPEASSVITFLKNKGIGVSIVTGDNRLITTEIIKDLGLKGEIVNKDNLKWNNFSRDTFTNTAAFAEVLPEDKLNLVKLAKKFFIVIANGDGINDLPAVKEANVGIAVSNAVDALKSSADIVLTTPGISVIRDAIIESRKIFERISTYAMYRISESQRLIVTAVFLGAIFKVYPLTPLQIIVLALLNDIPIISLAFDRVETVRKPSSINTKRRYILSTLFGVVGIANSLILFYLLVPVFHVSWPIVQTVFFLKLTVSGHLLIYIAHTQRRWYKFLPSREVIIATTATQLISTLLALSGFLMPTKISLTWVLLVWAWSFIWMQVGELAKIVQQKAFPQT